jgi:hypothetical protein
MTPDDHVGLTMRMGATLSVGAKQRIEWPDGKSFAFTIFDDTDNATIERVGPVYDFLYGLGLGATKSVWPLQGEGTPAFRGSTCEDPDYLAWTLGLQAKGFEIGYHGATYVTSPRERVIAAIERFRDLYGHYPLSMANHTGCAESIYWGADRVTGINRLGYNLLTRFTRNGVFRGHRDGDPLFWGDICKAKVRYVRNFTFRDIDTLATCPMMPYHDPGRPYVNHWFAASEGTNVDVFNRCVSETNMDRLEDGGGACVMYTHFASAFADGGQVNPRFKSLMERLARKNGWFVSVTTLLDYLLEQHGPTVISPAERRGLERRWLLSKLTVGPS